MAKSKPGSRGKIKRDYRRHVAPGIAGALGGPLAGAAVSQLSRAIFGADDADEETLAETLERARPRTSDRA